MPTPLDRTFTIPFGTREAALLSAGAYKGKGTVQVLEVGGAWVVRIIEETYAHPIRKKSR